MPLSILDNQAAESIKAPSAPAAPPPSNYQTNLVPFSTLGPPPEALPKAHFMPWIESSHTETPSPVNPLGVKGVGAAGTIGCSPAVVNSVVDALSPLGVRHTDMPLTPEKIWRLIEGGRARNAEALLEGGADIDAAAAVVGEGIDANSDLYASAEYRLHLARVHAARALRTALSRAE